MKSLAFEALSGARSTIREKRIRRAAFQARSLLPVSAACVVANGVRETLSSLLAQAVVMRLIEPSIPSSSGWRAILENARLYLIRGKVADAGVVLRPADAIALAAALFGEAGSLLQPRSLSRVECDVLDRMVASVALSCGAVCGVREGRSPERVGALDGFVTYFELLVEAPLGARIGIALSRDPSPERSAAIDATHLASVKLKTSVLLEVGSLEAAQTTRLGAGAVLPIAAAALARCTLAAHGHPVARGVGGASNGRYALMTDSILRATGP
jgi:flagellar motor switch protein FliM